ncbi:MAG: pyruvate kinase [Candidatus Paceibacterota bacterium]
MNIQKKTKIVATIGPATESEKMIEKLFLTGLDVVRLNFSHGDHEEHQKRVDIVKKISKKIGKNVAILQDLAGPKIRIGDFATERIQLKEGQFFTLTTEKITGDEKRVYINYPNLSEDVKIGGFVLLDDGKKKLQIVDIKDKEVKCLVVVGGEIKGRRGVNLPGAYLKISSITEKDKRDFAFAVKNKVDFLALSFVRKPEDVIELRKMIERAKIDTGIISKIETPEAVENIDKIIEISDGIMVARGDLSIEVPAEKVPMIQKMIIKKCNDAGKPVITATQMLESMINIPVPTRAEVSDIANAIFDGTDAVMLSEETTLGKFPLEAVGVMSRVALEVERGYRERSSVETANNSGMEIVNSITKSVVNIANDVGAKLIFALTETGFSARMVSRHKPNSLIMALSPNERACKKLSLSFGCYPVCIKRFLTLPDAFNFVRTFCLKNKLSKKGDKVVVVAGAPFNKKGVKTNMIIVEVI